MFPSSRISRRALLKASAVTGAAAPLLGPVNPATALPALSKLGESACANAAQWDEREPGTSVYLNARAHRYDGIVTYNGWQYVAFWQLPNPADLDRRRVAVARRQLPGGPWQTLVLSDYEQEQVPAVLSDNHRVVAIGICPGDGTLHLAFDHHQDPLHYRRSVPGVANDPTAFTWNQFVFEPIQDHLAGDRIVDVTYPLFSTTPGGRLLFTCRTGRHGNLSFPAEHWILHEYDGSSGQWQEIGEFLSGADIGDGQGRRRPYPNGLTYDTAGRLHLTWTWRAAFDPNSNHDLMYTYSDDHGRSWCNNAGQQLALPIKRDSPGVRVWEIPQGSGLINSEGQTADTAGRVHVVFRDTLNADGQLRLVHYWRALTGSWVRQDTSIEQSAGHPLRRAKIVTDPDGNAFILTGNLSIHGATRASAYSDWGLVTSADSSRFAGEPLYDQYRQAGDGRISVLCQQDGGAHLYVLDYVL